MAISAPTILPLSSKSIGGDEGETATRTTFDSSFEQPMIATLIKHSKLPKRVRRFMLLPLNQVKKINCVMQNGISISYRVYLPRNRNDASKMGAALI
jgi:hypothetical protein